MPKSIIGKFWSIIDSGLYLAYSILLAQLIATLIYYLCTVALTGLADWYMLF